MKNIHKTLTDDIFRNCKYIYYLEEYLKTDNIKKTHLKQYNIMLDIVKTIIELKNILVADSDRTIADKITDLEISLEKCLFGELDNDSEKYKYSTRDIKGLTDKHTRYLYNKFKEWYEYLSNIGKLDFVEKEILNEMYRLENNNFDIKILALKSKQTMEILKKDGFAINDIFFPNCMYSYLLKDKQLELIGMCDKIEIIDGKYYPISIKNSNPPIKGIWDQDAIELVAYAILIEEDFDTEVFVGFVDYEKIGERRPVVMDVNLRKGLFDVIKEVKEIIENKKLPHVKKNDRKCGNCEYKEICFKN